MRTDEMIKKDVVDSMYWDSRIDASDISVEVEDGEVTLSGNVPTYTGKLAAMDDAWLVNRVENVKDQLDVKYPPQPALPSDRVIRDNILNAFRWDPDLFSYSVDVEIAKGWVTLEGTIDAYWEKIRAENVAWGIRGVIGVTNKLAVVPTDNVTDEIIAEDIVNAIDRNLHVIVDNVNVKVENGQVTLNGTVSSWAAKSAAFDAVAYTVGVTDVEGNLMVREPQRV